MATRRTSRYQSQKSPDWRFLFVLRLLIFLMYLAFGIVLIFWKELPLSLTGNYRLALGILLIVYASIRFGRLLKREEKHQYRDEDEDNFEDKYPDKHRED